MTDTSLKLNRLRRQAESNKQKNLSQNLRIRTEPDCDENAEAISRRISQIKSKYNIKQRQQTALGEINHQQISNICGVNIKEVDSPMNCLGKAGSSNRFFSRAQGESPSTTTLTRQPSESKELSQLSSSIAMNDPRIQNIDKINLKIRNILDNFDALEGRLLGYNGSTPSNNPAKGLQRSENSHSKLPPQPVKKTREHISTSYSSATKPLDARGKFDINKHAYRHLMDEDRQDNVRAGKTECYQSIADRRTSFESNYRPNFERSNQKESNTDNYQFKLRRMSDFDEVKPRSYQTPTAVPRPATPIEDQRPKEVNRSTLSVFPKRERVYVESAPQPPAQKTESKRLYAALKKQVQLDEEYRNKKYVFKQMKAENKLFGLMAELSNMGIKIERSEQLATDMKISEEEYNPFYTCRGEGTYKDIATAYIEAKRHWERDIVAKFDQHLLTQEGFTEQAVDLDKKGYLSVEDLVRLLNLEADTFVRNRDLVLIHRRLAKNTLTFSELVRQLCG